MTTDDLSAPLGQDRPRKRRYRLPFTAPQAIAGLFGVFLAVFLGFAIFNTNPMGGEPLAKVSYDPRHAARRQCRAATGQCRACNVQGGRRKRQGAVRRTADHHHHRRLQRRPAERHRRHRCGRSGEGRCAACREGGYQPKTARKLALRPDPRGGRRTEAVRVYAAGSDADRAAASKTPSIAIVVSGLGVVPRKLRTRSPSCPAR